MDGRSQSKDRPDTGYTQIDRVNTKTWNTECMELDQESIKEYQRSMNHYQKSLSANPVPHASNRNNSRWTPQSPVLHTVEC